MQRTHYFGIATLNPICSHWEPLTIPMTFIVEGGNAYLTTKAGYRISQEQKKSNEMCILDSQLFLCIVSVWSSMSKLSIFSFFFVLGSVSTQPGWSSICFHFLHTELLVSWKVPIVNSAPLYVFNERLADILFFSEKIFFHKERMRCFYVQGELNIDPSNMMCIHPPHSSWILFTLLMCILQQTNQSCGIICRSYWPYPFQQCWHIIWAHSRHVTGLVLVCAQPMRHVVTL